MKRPLRGSTGAMEGMPIQLIIVVAVGMAALAILIGWLAFAGDSDATLRRITTDPETIKLQGDGRISGTVDVTLYIYDSEGNEVDGVVVTFSGSVDSKSIQEVDSGDTVPVEAVLASGEDTATINVLAQKSGGMGSCETTMIVMREQS